MTKPNAFKRILLILIPILIIGAALGYHFMHKTRFTSTYEVGNSAGNLYNGGTFCEYNGTVYFSNPNDKNRLYSMSRSGSDIKKLSDDVASYINADSHYLYYTRNNSSDKTAFSFLHIQENSLCRINHNGKNLAILSNDPSMYAKQIGDYIYFVHYDTETASTLYRVKIDGSDEIQVRNAPIIPAASVNQYLYFAGVSSDHKLYRIDSSDSSNTMQSVSDGGFYNPILVQDVVYYMDCYNDYALTRLNLTTGESTVLVPNRLDCFNLYGDWVYYQQNSNDQGLYRIKTDGTEKEKVQDGNFTNINITSSFVYFYDFQDTSLVYKTPTNGSVSVTLFNP